MVSNYGLYRLSATLYCTVVVQWHSIQSNDITVKSTTGTPSHVEMLRYIPLPYGLVPSHYHTLMKWTLCGMFTPETAVVRIEASSFVVHITLFGESSPALAIFGRCVQLFASCLTVRNGSLTALSIYHKPDRLAAQRWLMLHDMHMVKPLSIYFRVQLFLLILFMYASTTCR